MIKTIHDYYDLITAHRDIIRELQKYGEVEIVLSQRPESDIVYNDYTSYITVVDFNLSKSLHYVVWIRGSSIIDGITYEFFQKKDNGEVFRIFDIPDIFDSKRIGEWIDKYITK